MRVSGERSTAAGGPGAGFHGGFLSRRFPLALFLCAALFTHASCATSGAASVEEYFSIGMAYFDLGKYAEAEAWLNRARAADKTRAASEYNLGRVAFEMGRYDEAAMWFERVLERDADNVQALKAAAFARIKAGDFARAEAHYERVLALVPESADDGYNHALVLFVLDRFAEAEETLLKYRFALDSGSNKDTLLLLARTQKAQDKVEALDTYARWLEGNSDVKVQYEYAGLLEEREQYAKALEQYRAVLTALPANSKEPAKSGLRFTIARLLLTADPDNEEGPKELAAAVEEGFSDEDALKALLGDKRLSDAGKKSVQAAIDSAGKNPPEAD
ncbi:MAG: tetratricopeptide repeat protein [Treponematales bacterium]